MRAALFAAIMSSVFGACGGAGSGDVCTGGWHVCRGQIRDAQGRAVILRGLNVADENKAAPYLGWAQQADLTRMRSEWGLNGLRWVMPWSAVEPARGAYDDAYLDQVRARLDWAAAAGMVVVLDMHQDVFGEGFGFDGAPRWACDEARYAAFVPQTPWSLSYTDPNVIACFDGLYTDPSVAGAFADAWAHVAARLGDHPAVIGFDTINEPHWGSYPVAHFERDRLEAFDAQVIDAVRAQAPGWLAFVEPASSRNLGIPTTLTPFAQRDVVYAPHAYDTQAEQGNGFDPARRDDFIANIALLRDEADKLDAALWIGEYGGVGSDPQIGAYLDAAYDGAAAALGSTMAWSYSRGGYGPIDSTGAEIPAMTAALVRPYPSRIAGDPIAWSYDETTRALTVSWKPDPAAGATELIVPARFGAFDVACEGCAVTIAGDVVSITAPSGASDVTARLAPR
ncbi:MAG TPA: cellulase family glycosylhydrolase [Kofleriaceae bacterium]|nr:cellulase family glycosylhydrolase [Kofleriaceae bacterium]